MNKLSAGKASIFALIATLLVYSFLLGKSLTSVFANGNAGAIWTTASNCGPQQNVNHYPSGTDVWVNGSGFNINTILNYTIQDPGNNGANVIPPGTVTTSNTGTFCFDAGAVPVGGPYQTNVGGKNDNFSIDAVDLCANIRGTQTTVPDGYHQVGDNCYPVAGTCPTACGQQASTVPDGNGGTIQCDATPACETDICSNIAGVQTSVPEGDYQSDGECLPKTGVCNDPAASNYQALTDQTYSNSDLCKYNSPSPEPTPLVCTGDTHPDATGQNCVTFSNTNPPEVPYTPQGQVLGASTMAGTGSFAEDAYMAIMGLGGILSAIGLKKASKRA